MNSREEFHMNIFDILCTSTQGQNFGEGQGHSGNDVIYTRSHWELDLVGMYD